jgi:hypothetical protein
MGSDDAEASGEMEGGNANEADLTGTYFVFPFVVISWAVRNPCRGPETRLSLIQATFGVSSG